MYRVLMIVPAMLLLAGCALVRQQQRKDAMEHYNQEVLLCQTRIPDVVGRARERAMCISRASDEIVAPEYPEEADLFQLLSTERVQLAGQVDKGTLTSDDAAVAFAQAKAQIVSEMRQRDQADAAMAAERRAAGPHTRVCNDIGGTVICSSF